MSVRVSLTGRVAIEGDKASVDEQGFPGRQGRIVFAYLLAEPGRLVPRDELAEALWGERLPATWEKALAVLMSKLRGLLDACGVDGSSALTSAFGCYRLALPDGSWIDVAAAVESVQAAEAALAAGRLDDARAEATAAAALSRRTFLPGEDGPWVEAKRRELGELLVRALGCQAEAELRAGNPTGAVHHAEDLTALEPFRESGYRLLMRAHAAAGDDAEALRVYERCRTTLGEELGTYPSAETEAVYLEILRGSSGSSTPAEVSADPGPAPAAAERSRRRPVVLAGATIALAVAGVLAVMLFRPTSAPAIPANGLGVVDLSSGRARGGTELGRGLGAVAYGAGGVWAADPAGSRILRFDPRTHQVVDRIGVRLDPEAVAVCDGAVWVAGTASGIVAWINPATDDVVERVHSGNGPSTLACAGRSLWVGNRFDDTLTRVDTRTGDVEGTVGLPSSPTALAFGLGSLWVAAQDGTVLDRFDPGGTLQQEITVGPGVVAVAAGPEGLWVANRNAGTVSRIDPDSGATLATLRVAEGPGALALGEGSVWFADELEDRVTRIRAQKNTVSEVIRTTGLPGGLASAGGELWVTTGPPAAGRGGTLHVVTGRVWQTPLDGAVVAFPLEAGVLAMTNDALVGYRWVGGVAGGALVPDLAVAIPAPTDDGRTYVFRVRRGIRYSSGARVQPSDVRRALERSLRVNPGNRSVYAAIRGASACNDHACDLRAGVVADDAAGTVTFHLTSPDPDLVAALAYPSAYLVPAGVRDPNRKRPVVPATGPYMVAAYDAHGVRLVRNPYFHVWSRTARPDGFPDAIDWRVGAGVAGSIGAVEQGRADLVDTPAIPRSTQTRFAGLLQVFPQPRTQFAFLNTRSAPFDDVRARRALAYAVDRRVIVGVAGGAISGAPTCQLIPPGAAAYRRYCPYTRDASSSGAWLGPDLPRARKLVAESGTLGRRVVVRTAVKFGPVGRYVTRTLDRLGYRASLTIVPDAEFFTTAVSPKSWQVSIFNLVLDYTGAKDALDVFGCKSAANPSFFCDARLDRALRTAHALEQTSPAAADAAWERAERVAVDEAPFVALVNLNTVVVASHRTSNIEFNPEFGVMVDQIRIRHRTVQR